MSTGQYEVGPAAEDDSVWSGASPTHLSAGLVLDDTSFGRDYAVLATTMTSVTPDDVADILQSISGKATGVTRDDLDRVVGALVQVNDELVENENAARKLDATRKRSRTMPRVVSLDDLEAGLDDVMTTTSDARRASPHQVDREYLPGGFD